MQNYVIAHIPHASPVVPFPEHYTGDVAAELALVTDWATDQMVTADESVIFPFSRLWCDVERLIDDPLNARGLGLFYTHRSNGDVLRQADETYVTQVNAAYHAHHKKVSTAIAAAISLMPVCLLDIHSYSDQQAKLYGHCEPYPEICLGYADDAVPAGLIAAIAAVLNDAGYSVGHNQPYEGALIPTEFADNPDFFAVMIEVNKSVYLDDANAIISDRFTRLQDVLKQVVDVIRHWPTGA